jgi:hypothetical protein
MCYSVENESEMLDIIRRLLADEIVFVVTTLGDEWVETTLARAGEGPRLNQGQAARIVSWTGIHDTNIGN